MELFTPNGICTYVYFKKSSNIFKFKVKARLSTHIALATYTDVTKPYIEFVIEHFSNEKNHESYLRTRASKNYDNRVTVATNGFLNENEFRGFWISFEDGKYACGREGEVIPFMKWDNPNPYEINYIGVYSYLCDGLWNLNDNIDIPECKPPRNRFTPIEEAPIKKGCKVRQQDPL